jgi:hypothetical protein
MTNLGFYRAMASERISVHATPVGDRHVLAALDANGWSLGGEQSGHLVFRDLATTGDGVLSGLLLADLVARSGRALAELAGEVMERFPQVLRNVVVNGRDGLGAATGVWDEVAAVEAELGDSLAGQRDRAPRQGDGRGGNRGVGRRRCRSIGGRRPRRHGTTLVTPRDAQLPRARAGRPVS